MTRYIALFFILLLPSEANAHPKICYEEAFLKKQLSETFKESLSFIGATPVMLIEIWTNKKTGSFTLIETFPGGVSCQVLAGNYHEFLKPVVTGKDEESKL